MSSFEFEGKNVEKAVQNACEQLKLTPDELNYEILSYGSSGIFGFAGAKKASIFSPNLAPNSNASPSSSPFGLKLTRRPGVIFKRTCFMRSSRFRTASPDHPYDPNAPASFMDAMRAHPAFHGYFTINSLRELFEQANLRVIHLEELQQAEAPNVMKELGCRGLLSFMWKTYPKLALRLIRDANLRKVQSLDDHITKKGKEYTGCVLIVGKKI